MSTDQPVSRAEFEALKKYIRELEKDYESLKNQLIQKGTITAGLTHPRGTKPL